MRMKKIVGVISFVLGLLIVVGSHLWMLSYGLTPDQMMPHAVSNLVAAVLLAIGYFMKD